MNKQAIDTDNQEGRKSNSSVESSDSDKKVQTIPHNKRIRNLIRKDPNILKSPSDKIMSPATKMIEQRRLKGFVSYCLTF
jgi:hypothetical protein